MYHLTHPLKNEKLKVPCTYLSLSHTGSSMRAETISTLLNSILRVNTKPAWHE